MNLWFRCLSSFRRKSFRLSFKVKWIWCVLCNFDSVLLIIRLSCLTIFVAVEIFQRNCQINCHESAFPSNMLNKNKVAQGSWKFMEYLESVFLLSLSLPNVRLVGGFLSQLNLFKLIENYHYYGWKTRNHKRQRTWTSFLCIVVILISFST